jgi:protein-disulfide isomerase
MIAPALASAQPPPDAVLQEEQAKIDAALQALTARRPARPDMAQFVGRYGRIVDSKPVGVTGLTAWTVQSNGRQITLYTPADGRFIFAGVILDAASGALVSGQNAAMIQPPGMTAGQGARAALEGKFTGSIPESIQSVAALAGVTEGNGGVADTLFVIIDPRCPFSRQAYARTRDYVKRGMTIKWIPAVALGKSEEGVPLAATLLQAKDPANALKRLMGGESLTTQPNEKTQKALLQNLDFLFSAFKHTPSVNNGRAVVPVGFYIDHRTGHPSMKTGLSEQVILEDIFGK